MCGISGVFTKELTDKQINIVNAIVKDQHSRGPDHQATLKIQGNQAQVLLGHNRLSIIDLSQHSNQPMVDSTKRYTITFNGEIYNYLELRTILREKNYIFNTQGDTEVILNAFAHWGMDALNHFKGPFAFALFDKKTDEIWLCRDRFGVRPLYYVLEKERLYFASSTRILAQHLKLNINFHYVNRGLTHLVYEDESDISPYENMQAVPAGMYLHAKMDSQGKFQSWLTRYYDLNINVTKQIETLPMDNLGELLQMITHRLDESINLRLRTDVPLGVTLSSGLDSSSIASLVNRQNLNTIGFSFGHPLNSHSEGPLVAKYAKQINMKMEYVNPTPNEIISAILNTIKLQDAPFASLSIVAQNLLYQRIRAQGVKVVLGGQGGDEIFMGYRKFMLYRLQEYLKQKNYLSFVKYFIQLIPMLNAEIRSVKTYWQHRHRFLKPNGLQSGLCLPNTMPYAKKLSNASLQEKQLADITQFSLPTLLRYEDRNAMGNSVESRLPFLDHHLVELGCALPAAIKLRKGYGKWPLRQIMQDKVPPQIRLAYYKRGFDISMRGLIKNGLGKSLRNILHSYSQGVADLLTADQSIDRMFSDQQLLQRSSAIAEAISLLWINKAYQ